MVLQSGGSAGEGRGKRGDGEGGFEVGDAGCGDRGRWRMLATREDLLLGRYLRFSDCGFSVSILCTRYEFHDPHAHTSGV